MRLVWAAAWMRVVLVSPANAGVPVRNGFSLEPASIPIDEILEGGPSRDGITALDHPPFLLPAEAPWKDADLVLGVESEGEARAYPVLGRPGR